jgi:hypothetical protein
MGNLGKSPENWIALDTRNVEAEQIRSIGLSALSLRKDPYPDFAAEDRLSRNSKTQTFKYWFEYMFRVHVKYGLEIVSFYIRVALNNTIVYYHILQDKSQITITHIKAHCEWYGDCPFGKKALEDSGQLLLKAIGSELSKEVLAGSSSNMPGPMVLF